MADAYQQARWMAWVAVMRHNKVEIVQAVIDGHARGENMVTLCDTVQALLDHQNVTFNATLDVQTRYFLDTAAPAALQ